jgi:hypothetical protein
MSKSFLFIAMTMLSAACAPFNSFVQTAVAETQEVTPAVISIFLHELSISREREPGMKFHSRENDSYGF